MIKNSGRRIISLMLMVILCLSFSVTVYAGEENTINTCEANCVSIAGSEMSLEEMAFYEKVMSEELQVGETMILSQNGTETIYVEVIDENNMMTRSSSMTQSKVFKFYKTLLGIKKDLFQVTLTCYWTKDGQNSKITNLKGSYETLSSGVSCSWNGNYTKANDFLHTLGLDFTYNYGLSSGFVFFSGSMNLDMESITLDCSADY